MTRDGDRPGPWGAGPILTNHEGIPMPVSTEVLNEDIKELKGDIHKLAIGLAELRTEVRDAIALAKWAGTVLVVTLLTSGVGAIIWGASLTAKVYGLESRTGEKFVEVGTRIDERSREVVTRIDGVEKRVGEKFVEVGTRIDKLEVKIDKVEAKIDKLESRIDKLEAGIDARFDKLEASIARVLDQLKPAAPKPGP